MLEDGRMVLVIRWFDWDWVSDRFCMVKVEKLVYAVKTWVYVFEGTEIIKFDYR